MAMTISEVPVDFHGDGAGVGELTWGQLWLWRTARETGRTMNLVTPVPLAEGTPLAEVVALLRFIVSRHPALRTRLSFAGPSGSARPRQVVAASGELPLQIADIDDDDDVAAATEELWSRYERTWFDYENEFPVRMGVVRQSGVLRVMVAGVSHVMLDGAGIEALTRDTGHLDRVTGRATAPVHALDPLELARVQGGPVGRRQNGRSLRHWATQIGRLTPWRNDRAAEPCEPRFQRLVAYSSALELGLRAVAARTGTQSTYVLLAAYAVAVARVLHRNPSVAQIVVSNRFRPGFADAVLQVAQPGICVVDAEAASFDEVLGRAVNAATTASFFGYYDPAELDDLLDGMGGQTGPLDISWHLNDRRALFATPQSAVVAAPDGRNAAAALPETRMSWDGALPTFNGTLFMQVDAAPEPSAAGTRAPDSGPPAVCLGVWTDTWHFALDQIEALVREMESVVVTAASDLPSALGTTTLCA